MTLNTLITVAGALVMLFLYMLLIVMTIKIGRLPGSSALLAVGMWMISIGVGFVLAGFAHELLRME